MTGAPDGPLGLTSHGLVRIEPATPVEETRAGVAAALDSLRSTLVFDSRDWARNGADAWLYAVIVGWECEDPQDCAAHDRDEACTDTLMELAHKHAWSDATVERLRLLRKAYRELETSLVPHTAPATFGPLT